MTTAENLDKKKPDKADDFKKQIINPLKKEDTLETIKAKLRNAGVIEKYVPLDASKKFEFVTICGTKHFIEDLFQLWGVYSRLKCTEYKFDKDDIDCYFNNLGSQVNMHHNLSMEFLKLMDEFIEEVLPSIGHNVIKNYALYRYQANLKPKEIKLLLNCRYNTNLIDIWNTVLYIDFENFLASQTQLYLENMLIG